MLKIFFILCLCSVASSKVTNQLAQVNVKPENKSPYAVYNTCGGYIEAKLDQTIILEYKPDEEYNNDELCVWEIRNGEVYYALITKTLSGFEAGYDYLQVSGTTATSNPPTLYAVMRNVCFYWGNTTGIEQVNARGIVNFVIFSSDDSNRGTGFRLEIIGYEERTAMRVFDDFFSVSPIGSTTLRPYFNTMTQVFLISPEHKSVQNLVLDVEIVTEPTYDYLSVYSMERNGQAINFRQHESRLSGNASRSYVAEYYTNFVVFFFSDPNGVPDNGGIDLSWYVQNSTTTENHA